jgi:hypothetical protein
MNIQELSRLEELNNLDIDINIEMDEDRNITNVKHNLKEIILRAYEIGHMQGLIDEYQRNHD